jgi:cyclopropane-fatty-acyl-phospholipid synthase
MSTEQTSLSDQAAERTKRLLDALFGSYTGNQVTVRLWDGTQWPDATPRAATIILQHPGALRQMFLPGSELGLAEAYLYGDFDVEGEIEAVFGLADHLEEGMGGLLQRVRLALALLRLPTGRERDQGQRGRATLDGRQHSLRRDREAVRYHYDVSNDFYALWLDQHMVYSCAYFASVDEDLDRAQTRKLDYLCRKLRLQPGQRLLGRLGDPRRPAVWRRRHRDHAQPATGRPGQRAHCRGGAL